MKIVLCTHTEKCKLRYSCEIQAFESNKSDDAAFMLSHKTLALVDLHKLSFKFEIFSSFIMMINQKKRVEYGVRWWKR